MKDEHLSLLDSGHLCIQGLPKAFMIAYSTILGPIGESSRLAPGMPASCRSWSASSEVAAAGMGACHQAI